MAKLTPEQENFDVSQFFDPDAPPGEPVLQQIQDPFNGDIVGPGMRVDTDGRVHWTDGLGSD
jgi:hypothetical protein